LGSNENALFLLWNTKEIFQKVFFFFSPYNESQWDPMLVVFAEMTFLSKLSL